MRKNGVKRKGHLCKEEKRYELPERGLHPFLGSGSTLIAGEKTDHVCRGIEFDPKFVDVIVKRYIVNIKWLFVLKLKFFLVQSSLVQSSLKEYNKKDKIQKELPT